MSASIIDGYLNRINRYMNYSKGKYCLITGGTSGIGFQLAKDMILLEMNVTITSSSQERVMKACQQIIKECNMFNKPIGTITGIEMDLSDLNSVGKGCNQLKQNILNNNIKLDIIVNNAGTVAGKEKKSKQGFNYVYATNYLGHFLMNHLLKPVLNVNGRIVIISSEAALSFLSKNIKTLEDMKFTNLMLHESSGSDYMSIKLFCSMYCFSLAEHWKDDNNNFIINCVHPGTVNTNLMKTAKENQSGIIGLLSYGVGQFYNLLYGISVEEAALNILRVAVDSNLTRAGNFYLEGRESKEHPIAYSTVEREKLWTISLKQIQDYL
ncbi:hypothetical protein ABK040_009071 [Willaertia magna]